MASDINYRIFKHKFEFENYLIKLTQNLKYYFISYRTRNHKLPIETGRWLKIERSERICNTCRKELGDEFHYMLVCETLNIHKKKLLDRKFTQRSNVVKYKSLMNANDTQSLISVSIFIKIIYTLVKYNAVETELN